MFVRAYLRASTKEQDANRAKKELVQFATDKGLKIAATYIENVSGTSLNRPELFRLLSDCHVGDILLIEQVDRLSRLNALDWELLKTEIRSRKIKVVALDLPTSWGMVSQHTDEFTSRMSEAINSMMLDMIAAIARKNYEDRIRRQKQGIAKAKDLGLYKGRPGIKSRNEAIMKMLEIGQSWNSIIQATGCSRSTLSRLKIASTVNRELH